MESITPSTALLNALPLQRLHKDDIEAAVGIAGASGDALDRVRIRAAHEKIGAWLTEGDELAPLARRR